MKPPSATIRDRVVQAALKLAPGIHRDLGLSVS